MMRARMITTLALLSMLMLGIAACGGTSGGTSSGTSSNTVRVSLYDDHVTTSQTNFTAGTPYHFVITNHSTTAQTFMMVPHDTTHMPMGEMHNEAMVWSQGIAPGATTSADYTFPMGMAHESFEMGCYTSGHSAVWAPAQVR